MLADADIHALESHLGTVVRENQQHHDNLQNLLQKFQELLKNYNSLKSDYEEEKEGRERYKRLARGQERNPFVLVLIDGDGYMFKEHLIKAGSDGGITAARLMQDSIREILHDRLGHQADQCRIMVRIYANVLGLSKTLARYGFVGHEARSLSPFVANLTSSQDLFDFVDAGDKKEAADYKIREMFRLFVDNNQCKHIFFAGCHDAGYLNLLIPYSGRTERITLLKAASFYHQYNTLNLPIRELPQVFMSTELPGIHTRDSPSQVPIQSQIIPPSPSRPVCRHYQKGICRYGNTCVKLHIQPSQYLSKVSDDTSSISDRETLSPRTHDYYAANLPTTTNPFYGDSIPINKTGDRIDTYCAAPSAEARELYNRRPRFHRPCNNFHLAGQCDLLNCEYDHAPLDDTSRSVMIYILRQNPCGAGLSCRSIKCFLGHHCQKDRCRGTKPCKFNRHAHSLDLQIATWVPALEKEDNAASSVSDASEEASPSDSDNTFGNPNIDTLS
ncbi:uncharacterized protein BP01DRAFT_424782 [Aspergillus saccharolyticus JOP 1030-1]|uniref:C3H1-type domain-containing protein n=1 Tax=Aspergillus saccharolyticus JOP 1030-1 TaxID=1450539 RepID=A0A318ZFQ0_9EURO|nr:hypothetical protein BP01DRAFT_424782 [Aspergillus saccharolyticus JOP 1030-1]PYH43453.1 hypothetical protein BP01DRAFT_424782 [Aspergillus saccharolyticus JOP 1030-1]